MPVEAVIFDWGGTLTPWKTMDGRAWWRITAALADRSVIDPHRSVEVAARLHAAEEELWRLAREQQRSATLAEVLAAADLVADDTFYAVYDAEFEWATFTDPDVPAVLTALRQRGIRIGLLSNTMWTRAQHERILARDGIDQLVDAAVYTCEIPWTKPHPQAFHAALTAVGVTAAECVFVGDRPFDDIFGASRVGMRTILVPHSEIPTVQRGHTAGVPDAVIHRLTDLLTIVDGWREVSQASLDGQP